MDDELHAIIAANGGFLFAADLNALGIGTRQIARLVHTRVLLRVRHGTYVDRAVFELAGPEERHRIMATSVLRKLGAGVVASHQTAAVLLGLDVFGVPLDRVHVTRLDGSSGRHEAGIVHHQGLVATEEDLVIVDDLAVTRPARTVFEMAAQVSTESAMVTASSALRLGVATPEELELEGERLDHWPGSQRARIAVRLADGRAETVGEVRSLFAMWKHGIPFPELQAAIEGTRYRVDFRWDLYRHVGEFDGAGKYGGLPAGLDARSAVIAEKRREDLIRARGYGMSRWMWVDLSGARVSAWARGLKAALDASRRQFTRGRTHIVLG